ncbi:hypothetical protein ScPMuIL_004073 [Solemya velum]
MKQDCTKSKQKNDEIQFLSFIYKSNKPSSVSEIQHGLRRMEKLKISDDSIFYKLGESGLISFSDYIFLLSVLSSTRDNPQPDQYRDETS